METTVERKMNKTLVKQAKGLRLDKFIWKIWSYVKRHRDSMESEKACIAIRDQLEAAIEIVGGRLDSAVKERQEATRELVAANRKLTKMRAQAKKMEKTLARPEVARLVEELDRQEKIKRESKNADGSGETVGLLEG